MFRVAPVVALVVAFFVSACQTTSEYSKEVACPGNRTWAHFLEFVETERGKLEPVGIAFVTESLMGEDAMVFMAAYNAVPPVSIYEADEVVLLRRSDAPGATWVQLRLGECANGFTTIPTAAVDMLRKGIVPQNTSGA